MSSDQEERNDYELPRGIEPACPQCRYDLRGLTNFSGARCPECGAKLPFDKLKFRRDLVAERRYGALRPARIWMPIHWSWPESLCVVVAIAITIYATSSIGRMVSMLVTPGLIALELIVAGQLIRAKRMWQLRRYERRTARRRRSETFPPSTEPRPRETASGERVQ